MQPLYIDLTEDCTDIMRQNWRTMWSHSMALSLKENGPAIIAVTPASMLGRKMVKQAFGIAGGDIRIGAEILTRAALSDELAATSGQYFDNEYFDSEYFDSEYFDSEYFDNDRGQFSSPHPDALDSRKSQEIVRLIEQVLEQNKL